MASSDLRKHLSNKKQKNDAAAERVLKEVNRILQEDLYSKKNVLKNLKGYQALEEVVTEAEADPGRVYTLEDIKQTAIAYRLKFLNSRNCHHSFPEHILSAITEVNATMKKNLKGFMILGTGRFFRQEQCNDQAMLFAATDLGNYYLIAEWGRPLPHYRKLLCWPYRDIERLFVSIAIFTAIVTLCLPTRLITLDRSATYWCGYRAGVYFHLLIFFMGFTVYFAFAFSRNISSIYWNRERDH